MWVAGDVQTLKALWDEQGYVVLRGLLDAEGIAELQEICDDVLRQWLAESSDPRRDANSTNMAFLTEPRYFADQPARLRRLLEFVSDESILNLLETLCGRVIFHNTQYFFEPADHTREGDWHRDQQFDAPDEEIVWTRMRETGVHLHVALVPDDHLEYVPGSHLRRDTPAEREVRLGLNGRDRNSPDMPGAIRIALAAGDAVLFSAWGLHRGRYVAGRTRRTFDVMYGTPCQWAVPPPTCFLDPRHLSGLSEHGRQFFARFADVYRERWLAGEFES